MPGWWAGVESKVELGACLACSELYHESFHRVDDGRGIIDHLGASRHRATLQMDDHGRPAAQIAPPALLFRALR